MNKIFITGAAGFIGSTLADRLLADGKTVVGWDNFSTGQKKFLEGALKNPNFKLIEGDNLDLPALTKAMAGCDTVFTSLPMPTCASVSNIRQKICSKIPLPRSTSSKPCALMASSVSRSAPPAACMARLR